MADFGRLHALAWAGCKGRMLPSCFEHHLVLLTVMQKSQLGESSNVKRKLDSRLVRLRQYTHDHRFFLLLELPNCIYNQDLATSAASSLSNEPVHILHSLLWGPSAYDSGRNRHTPCTDQSAPTDCSHPATLDAANSNISAFPVGARDCTSRHFRDRSMVA